MYDQTKKYMSEFEARKSMVEIGKRMYDSGFVAANDGNISIKISDDEILCTPTGVSKGFMTPDMMVKMNLDGTVISGKLHPSSEVKMHLRVYREKKEVKAVTHAHPPVATSFSIAGIELDQALLPEAVIMLGTVKIAPYATPGTKEVPESIAPYVKDYNAVLLANHGALTWGKDIIEAYHRMETLEFSSKILMYTSSIIGRQNLLNCNQVDDLLKIKDGMGIKSGGVPNCELDFNQKNDINPIDGKYREDLIEEITNRVSSSIIEKIKGGN